MIVKKIIILFLVPLFMFSFCILSEKNDYLTIEKIRKKINFIIEGKNPYSYANVNDMANIFVELIKFRKKKINPESKLCKYFNKPEEIINKCFNFNIILPRSQYDEILGRKNDLYSLTTEEHKKIDWKKEFFNSKLYWDDVIFEKIKNKTIDSSELIAHLSKSLIFVAGAYLNKNGKESLIDSIQDDNLFKIALNFLSSELSNVSKYKNIRNILLHYSIDDGSLVNFSNADLENKDLPFLFFFLNVRNNYDKINEIWLHDNNISNIHENMCNGLESLNILTLHNNVIEKMPVQLGQDCKKLSFLKLNNNKITTLLPESCRDLSGLNEIDLSNNKIDLMKKGFGENWTRLSIINLSNCDLNEIEKSFGEKWTEISVVDLSYNNIVYIQEKFGEAWKRLLEFNLSNNQINEIPVKFGRFWSEIQLLNLSHNKISWIPNAFGNEWDALKELNLSHNHITSFASDFCLNWTKLEVLDISNNGLLRLSENFADKCKTMRVVDISNNDLTILPKNFGQYWKDIEKINIENAGKNNEPITIPVDQSKVEWLKNRLYVGNYMAEEGEDYVLDIIKQKLIVDVENTVDMKLSPMSPWQKTYEWLSKLFSMSPEGSPMVSPTKSPKD